MWPTASPAHAATYSGMRDAQGKHQRLLPQKREAFLHVRVDSQREACFGDFRIFSRFQRLGGRFGRFAILPRIFLTLPRRNVPAAHSIEAVSRYEISYAVDCQNSGDAGRVVKEADKSSGNEHAALHSYEHGSIGAGELARRDHFLHQRVYGRPIHRGADAGNQGHGVEMPELQMAAPRDVRRGEHKKAADDIQQDAQVTAIQAIDQHAAEKRHEKSRQGNHDDLQADFYRRVRRREDVPAHAREVHSAAEERDEHGEEEKAEAALRPDQLPVHRSCRRRCHGAY